MKENKLQHIKTTGFKTPDHYFSQVEEQILNDLSLRTQIDASGFDVPKDYFDTVESQILNKVATQSDTKVIPLFSLKKIIYTASIAAALVLGFHLFFNTSEKINLEDLEMASIAYYLEVEDYTSNDLAALLTEEELDAFNATDSQISIDSIEDYLLNHATLEDLIIE
ncbi:MAG: hypothetical protein AB8B52_04555 [Winogradskyella sp.]|uniref:hypothetical protein n=1 Tax=Winogradskyella sp. TaxID=1883156 RepID=UPI00385AECDF